MSAKSADTNVKSASSAPAAPAAVKVDEKFVSGLESTVKQFTASLQKEPIDLKTAQATLAQLKIGLTSFQLLPPFTSSPAVVRRQLLIARETFESGALLSLKLSDVAAFERHVAQLKTYYSDYSSLLPASEAQYIITGLYLLGLLAHNRIAEFHTELELLSAASQSQPMIKYSIALEQRLMEGSYHKILTAQQALPHPAMAFFVSLLALSVRDKMAECAEKAYETFPIADAVTVFGFKSRSELEAYAKKREWLVSGDGQTIGFPGHAATGTAAQQQSARAKALAIPSFDLIAQTLGYATELERIV